MINADPVLLLLPGLDGTGRLFGPFLACVAGFEARVVSYPPDRHLSIDELADLVQGLLPRSGPLVLVAESFSGRVALELVLRERSRVAAVVLVASFASNPTSLPSSVAAMVPDLMFSPAPPGWLLRRLLIGADAPEDLITELGAAIRAVAPPVLAGRLREVLTRPAPPAGVLAGVEITYIRGTRDALVGKRGLESVRDTGAVVTVVDVDAPHLVLQREPSVAWECVRKILMSAPSS